MSCYTLDMTELVPGKDKRVNTNSLRLKGVSEISLRDSVISSQSLEEDRSKWAGLKFLPGIGKENLEKTD